MFTSKWRRDRCQMRYWIVYRRPWYALAKWLGFAYPASWAISWSIRSRCKRGATQDTDAPSANKYGTFRVCDPCASIVKATELTNSWDDDPDGHAAIKWLQKQGINVSDDPAENERRAFSGFKPRQPD